MVMALSHIPPLPSSLFAEPAPGGNPRDILLKSGVDCCQFMIFLFQILCVLGLVGCGFYARRRGLLSAQGTNDLARTAIALVYPALIFVSITALSLADLRANLTLPLLVMAIAMVGFGLGLLAIRFLGRVAPDTARAFLFHCL